MSLLQRIPLLLSICVDEIEKNWLDTEGLYRVAGPIKQVKALCAELDKGHYSRLQGHNDAHTITSTLKKFLKELPDPVIPNGQLCNAATSGVHFIRMEISWIVFQNMYCL